MEKEKMYQLSILYFNGLITFEDEKKLFEFIFQNDQNETLFRVWENEWMTNETKRIHLQTEWDLLKRKIEIRNAITPILKKKKRPLSRRIAVAAAIVFIVISITIVADIFFTSTHNEGYFTVETPSGEKSRIILPDGTFVWLNSASTITYSGMFNKMDRIIKLEGEAYFEVAKQNNKPFIVRTDDYDVLVKGTKFNVTSYRNDGRTTTTLIEGRVQIIHKNQVLDMSPGESVEIDVKTHEITRLKVNPKQYNSWVYNKIEFDAITLNELLLRLSRQYDVNIHFEPDKKQTKILNVSIKNDESIAEILEGLSKVLPIKAIYDGKDIYINIE